MVLYKLMVVHWSIFTLSLQLIYCASVHSNTDLGQNVESLCSHESERLIVDRGIGSSVALDLQPGKMHASCKRQFVAPESHGFFVRLKKNVHHKNMLSASLSSQVALNHPYGDKKTLDTLSKDHNATGSCPLSIFSSNDLLVPPWRVDPCQLEASGVLDEPVRLFQGRLKILWNHRGNSPAYRLLVTVIGRGHACQSKEKHPCLKIGSETLWCISEDLLCDGVQHCPSGREYDSDENADMCSKRKYFIDKPQIEMNMWEHLSMEILRNLFTSADGTTPQPPAEKVSNSKTNNAEVQNTVHDDNVEIDVKRNRATLTRGLSRYGPWGYLMLGMLLCGGALLICGLWECCCRHQKPASGATNNMEQQTGTTTGPGAGAGDLAASMNSTNLDTTPPNYDEIDPPPSYAALFPNQKSTEDLSQLCVSLQDALEAGGVSSRTTAVDYLPALGGVQSTSMTVTAMS